jgi:hypothetical protein
MVVGESGAALLSDAKIPVVADVGIDDYHSILVGFGVEAGPRG